MDEKTLFYSEFLYNLGDVVRLISDYHNYHIIGRYTIEELGCEHTTNVYRLRSPHGQLFDVIEAELRPCLEKEILKRLEDKTWSGQITPE